MAACTAQLTLDRPWREVCDFLADPRQYPAWASWVGPGLRRQAGEWIVRRPGAPPARLRLTERNAFGVADQWLLESPDRVQLIALRALALERGCELLLTRFREPGSSAAAWSDVAASARRDLQRLAQCLAAR